MRFMKKISQKCLMVAVAGALLLAQPTYAADWEDNTWEDDSVQMAAEVIYRPAGVAMLAGGTALFVVLLPFSLLTHSTKKTGETLVQKPFNFTFKRPVGSGVKDWDY